jgi:hypothetical protein
MGRPGTVGDERIQDIYASYDYYNKGVRACVVIHMRDDSLAVREEMGCMKLVNLGRIGAKANRYEKRHRHTQKDKISSRK